MKLIEWLAGDKAQHMYADINYEYPVQAGITVNTIIASYGKLKPDAMPLVEDRREQEGRRHSGRQGRLRQLMHDGSDFDDDVDTPMRRQHRSGRAPHSPAALASSFRGAVSGRSSRRIVLAPLASLRVIAFTRRRRDLAASRRLCAARCRARYRAAARRRRGPRPRSPASAPPGSSPPIEFPGRDTLAWLLPLPLAFPTYIVAYVYVDILDAAGPVQTALRAAVRLAHRRRILVSRPSARCRGAIFVMGLVLYPYVYLAARAMFQTQSASLIEVARTLGATPLACWCGMSRCRWRGPRSRSGFRWRCSKTLNDIGASEYLGVQTLTLSIFTTWLNRGSLPGAAQIACVMLVVVIALMALERYGRRHRRFTVSLRRQRIVPRIAAGRARCAVRALVLPAAGAARLLRCPSPFSPARGDRARIADRLRSRPAAPHHHHRLRLRRPRPRSRSRSALPPPSPRAWCATGSPAPA